jgi:hypothetical protein
LPFVIGWPGAVTVNATWITPVASKTPVLAFSPVTIIVGVGAHVQWGDQNLPVDSIDVVFDDPTAVEPSCWFINGSYNCSFFPATGGGNIAPFFPDTAALTSGDVLAYVGSRMRARTFPIAGTYPYHSRRYPSAHGKVIVEATP